MTIVDVLLKDGQGLGNLSFEGCDHKTELSVVLFVHLFSRSSKTCPCVDVFLSVVLCETPILSNQTIKPRCLVNYSYYCLPSGPLYNILPN